MGRLRVGGLSYLPLFGTLTLAANPALAEARQRVMTTFAADPAEGTWQFGLAGAAGGSGSSSAGSGCDAAKRWLLDRSVRYSMLDGSGAALVGVGAVADRI